MKVRFCNGRARSSPFQSCALAKPTSIFEPTARQVFYRLILASVAATDRLTLDWVDPSGTVAVTVPYDQLPAAASLCFVSQLPVAGFAPAMQPGEWHVRVTVNGAALHQNVFRIKADPQASGMAIRAANLREVSATENELVVDGLGFAPDSVVNIAQYTASGGWTYLHHLFRAKEILASRLATYHNLSFYFSLMKSIRNSIVLGNFSSFKQSFLATYETQ